jgi:hypothetical protein
MPDMAMQLLVEFETLIDHRASLKRIGPTTIPYIDHRRWSSSDFPAFFAGRPSCCRFI